MNMELIFHIEHVKRHIKKLLLQMCVSACLSRHSHLLALDINNLQTEDKNSRGNICLELKYLSHLSCYLPRGRTRPILNTCPMSTLNICFQFCIHSEVKNSKISKSSFPPKFQVFASVSGDSSSVVQLCGPYTWSTGLLASLHQPTIIHLPFSWLLNFAGDLQLFAPRLGLP